MAKKKEKKVKKIKVKEKVIFKTKLVEVDKIVDGVIKTELGYKVVHNGQTVQDYVGSNSFRVAIKDYITLAGI